MAIELSGLAVLRDRHRDLAGRLEAGVRPICRWIMPMWMRPAGGWSRRWGRRAGCGHRGGEGERLDVRTLCLIRETLARHDGLADFAFAMQGLGMGAVSLFGTPEQRAWLARTRAGGAIAGFALTEPGSGSDVAATATTAARMPGGWRAGRREDLYFQRRDRGCLCRLCPHRRGARRAGPVGVSDARGCARAEVAERIEVIAPHPLAHLRLDGVILPERADRAPGAGFKVAMSVLDVFRSTVGAAALGLCAARAGRGLGAGAGAALFRGPLSIADGAGPSRRHGAEIDAAALLVYRAAWTKDMGAPRVSREAAMAKLYATEAAQRGDRHGRAAAWRRRRAQGLHGGKPLPRDPRLRIYEGASDVQRVVIARGLLA
jgi:acyl-CoA dehydrogenase